MEFSETAAAALTQSALQGSSPYILSLDTELEGLLQTLDDIQALASALKGATSAASADSKYLDVIKQVSAVSSCAEWLNRVEKETAQTEEELQAEQIRFAETLDSMPVHIKQRFKAQSKADNDAQSAAASSKHAASSQHAQASQTAAGEGVGPSGVLSWFGRLRAPSSAAAPPPAASATGGTVPSPGEGASAAGTAASTPTAASSQAPDTRPDAAPRSTSAGPGARGPGALASAAGKLFSGWGRRLSSELSYGGAVKAGPSSQPPDEDAAETASS